MLATGYQLSHQEQPEEQGGIGNVGWALDVDVGDTKKGEGKVLEQKQTEEAEDGEVVEEMPRYTANPESSRHEISNGPTTTQPTITATPRILRLVLIKSDILSRDPSAPKVAILDSQPSGYYLARDRSAGKPVVRLKEMVVSKVHALVWYGRRDEESAGESGRGEGEEKGFWIVDCGAFSSSLLLHKLMACRLDARDVCSSPIIARIRKTTSPLGTTAIIASA